MKYKVNRHQLQPLEEIDLDGVDLSGGICVLLPAYNEEENIERAVNSSVKVLETITENYEVLVVNDASHDRTGEIVEAMSEENPRIRIVHHKTNTRLGGAMRTGFENLKKDIVFYCDADNPVDMWDVKRSLPLMKDYDIVSGFRLNREETAKRKIYSRIYNMIVQRMFSFNMIDVNFSFKMIKRKVLDSVELHCSGGFIDGELIVLALRKGFKIAQVGVKYYPRTAGVSTMASPKIILQIMKEMCQFYLRIKRL